MKHLRKFPDTETREEVLSAAVYDILSYTEGFGINIKPEGSSPVIDYSTPFYIDVRGPVTLNTTSGLQMSADGETWTDTTATTLSSGKTYFRVASDQESPLKPNWTEDSNSDYDIGGNINSLVKVNFENDSVCYNFQDYFYNRTKLKSAGDLILPATTLDNECYYSMFQCCTSLTAAPELPATTLANNCYYGMFLGCTSLTTAPELPATTLDNNCYGNMFNGCTSLTAAPELPVTTLANSCYNNMFLGCTSLTAAPALPATTLANECYSGMFQGCTSLTAAPELPATTLDVDCYIGMFSDCTSLTTAPALPATTLDVACYYGMFHGCTNLNYIKCLATDISASYGTDDWVSGVSATGTFVKDPSMSSWPTGDSGIPSGWTVQDAA